MRPLCAGLPGEIRRCSGVAGRFVDRVERDTLKRAGPVSYLATLSPALPVLPSPRAEGALLLAAKRRGPNTVIADLRQAGSMKALFPKVRGDALQAVFLNTAGGLTGGDAMQITATAEPDAHIVISSQAAERAYRAQPGQIAEMSVTLDVGTGGRIDWLPQETILFDAAALKRCLRVHLATDATALLVEPIIFGRAAMGEVVHDLHFTDQWRICRNGALVYADAVRICGDADALLVRRAIAGGAGAMATVLLAAPNAAGFADLDLPENCGASLIANDLLMVRLLAADGFALRHILVPLIETLSAAPIPRVWRL